MPNRAAVFGIAVAVTMVVACGDSNSSEPTLVPTVKYKATLTGAAERPNPVTTSATGSFDGTYDPNTGFMAYTVTYTGLAAPSTASHIHCCGGAEASVGVLLDFRTFSGVNVPFAPGPTSQTYSGAVLLTGSTPVVGAVSGDSLKKVLDAGLTYVNVHSSQFPGGEIRGQIVKQQ